MSSAPLFQCCCQLAVKSAGILINKGEHQQLSSSPLGFLQRPSTMGDEYEFWLLSSISGLFLFITALTTHSHLWLKIRSQGWVLAFDKGCNPQFPLLVSGWCSIPLSMHFHLSSKSVSWCELSPQTSMGNKLSLKFKPSHIEALLFPQLL